MRIPIINGLIDRRILVNYIADPGVVARVLPPSFRPKLHNGYAVVGVCLIRLKQVTMKGLPSIFGIASENGAHRVAVEWNEGDEVRQGVFIPRRDTSSWINVLAGGRVFPGKHYRAAFDVRESGSDLRVGFTSSDGTRVHVQGRMGDDLISSSVFRSLEAASSFFEAGALGYSPNGRSLDGIRLEVKDWHVRSLQVSDQYSSFFSNEKVFPKGSVQFDHALLMRGMSHEWHSVPARRTDQ